MMPLVARMSPAAILRKVVFPQPLGPSNVTSEPASRSKEMEVIATSGSPDERGNC